MSVYFVILLSVLSSIAHRGSKVLVSLDALHLGANSFMVGVLAALYAVFPLLLAVYAGRISDRMGVRYPILFGSVGITAGLVLPALQQGLFTLFLCPTLIGLGQIFFHVSIHNAVGSIGGAAERAKNFSSFSLGASVATFIGPSLAGFSIDTLGFRPTFVVLAMTSLAVVLLPLSFPRLVPPHGDHERGGAHRNRVVLLLHARLRTVDRALRLAHRPGAQRLRRGGIRGTPGDAGACEALHRSGRADRVAFYRDSYVCAFSVSFRGSDAGADGVPARIGPGLGAAAHHHADLPPRSAGTLGRGARNEADGEQDHADFDSPGVRRNRRRVRPCAGVLGQRRFSAGRRNRFGEGSQRRPGIQRFTRARYPR